MGEKMVGGENREEGGIPAPTKPYHPKKKWKMELNTYFIKSI